MAQQREAEADLKGQTCSVESMWKAAGGRMTRDPTRSNSGRPLMVRVKLHASLSGVVIVMGSRISDVHCMYACIGGGEREE